MINDHQYVNTQKLLFLDRRFKASDVTVTPPLSLLIGYN